MAAAAQRQTALYNRRVVALKRADGVALTRVDIQFDFLHAVFADEHEVFTDPYMRGAEAPPARLCFRELYIKAILNSSKATKALKDKMGEPSSFAIDFAMLSLLVNVGRVNTTMSFFPEMKTTIRTYHPIPSLQRTNGNMQDAPRIKNILKTSLLEEEAKGAPSTPQEILSRCKDGVCPSTSAPNLIFTLTHHTVYTGQHFQGQIDFVDLFLRTDISSASRAKAFLWLCFNYLESPTPDEDEYDEVPRPNPFCDISNKVLPPSLSFITPEETAKENCESAQDIATTSKLMAQRQRIVQGQGAKESSKGKGSAGDTVAGEGDTAAQPEAGDETKTKGRRAGPGPSTSKGKGKRTPKEQPTTNPKPSSPKPISLFPDPDDEDSMVDALWKRRAALKQGESGVLPSDTARAVTRRFSPYPQAKDRPPYKHSRLYQPRSMFEQAWHIISSTDPLLDSDDETGGDEYAREDYMQRLRVINRFSLSFMPEESPYGSPGMDVDPV